MSQPTPIPLDHLPARMRMLAEDMRAVGAAIRYYGGFGPFGEYGDLIETQSAFILDALAVAMEQMQGGRA